MGQGRVRVGQGGCERDNSACRKECVGGGAWGGSPLWREDRRETGPSSQIVVGQDRSAQRAPVKETYGCP